MGVTLSAVAQRLPVSLPSLPDSVKVMKIMDNDQINGQVIRRAIVDSLNLQYRRLPRQLFAQQEITSVLSAHQHLAGLDDKVKQQFLGYVRSSYGPLKVDQFGKGLKLLKDTSRVNGFIDEKLRGFYALMKDNPAIGSLALPDKLENKVSGASAEMSYGDTTGNSSGWWNNVQLHDQLTIGSIPINLNYANVAGYSQFGPGLEGDHLVKFKFDKDAYLSRINAHIQEHYNLRKYFLDDIDFKAHLKSFVDDRMKSLQAGQLELQKIVNADQLIHLDSIQLRNLVFDKTRGDSLKALADTALEKYYSDLLQLKEELGTGLQMDKMLKGQHDIRNSIDRWMSNPSNIQGVAGDLLPMSGLQRFFMKIKDMNIGQIGADASKGTVSDLFMSGAAGSFLSKNKYLMTAIGNTREMNPRDIGLDATLIAPSKSMQFVRLGKGDLGAGHTHFSALNANARNAAGRAPNVMALAQNTFVGAFSKQLDLGAFGRIEAEFSKSSNVTGGSGAGQEHAAVSKAAVAHFFDDFFITASAGLNYSGAIDKLNLKHSVYFNYSGLGYNNPGNPYARRGTFQYGLNLKRTWLKNRASVHLRTDVRNMAKSVVTGSQWKNHTLSLDGRYRMSHKLTFSGRLHQSRMNAVSEHGSDAVYINRKVSFSSQVNGKMWRLPFAGNAMLGLQQLNYESLYQPVRSLFVNTNISHSIILGSRMISTNIFYNRDLKGAAIYSDLLNIDAGYSYSVLKILQCSSGLTYLDSKSVVRQIGVRQQLGARLLKRWTTNVSMDLRKDLLTTPQNYLYGNFRTEMSLQYQLN